MASSVGESKPDSLHMLSNVENENGYGTHKLPLSTLYSTIINLPFGLRNVLICFNTLILSLKKCREFAIKIPSSGGRFNDFEKSACITSKFVVEWNREVNEFSNSLNADLSLSTA